MTMKIWRRTTFDGDISRRWSCNTVFKTTNKLLPHAHLRLLTRCRPQWACPQSHSKKKTSETHLRLWPFSTTAFAHFLGDVFPLPTSDLSRIAKANSLCGSTLLQIFSPPFVTKSKAKRLVIAVLSPIFFVHSYLWSSKLASL